MGLCRKCSIFIAILAVMIPFGSIMYQQIDFREYNRRSTAEEAAKNAKWKGKTVIVTGASSGIGIPTAKVLYAGGATVIMACRNEKKAEKVRRDILSQVDDPNLNAKDLTVMVLDLSSLDSVDKFVQSFEKTYSALNILINNAGIMGLDEYTLSSDGVELQFATNNLGHFYLTQRLTRLLIKSSLMGSISRVINTASFAYFGAPSDMKSWLISETKMKDKSLYEPMQQYGLTKACNIIYAKEYNKRYAHLGVYAISLHPGIIRSGLQRYNWFARLMHYVPESVTDTLLKTTSQGAATQVRAAAMSDQEFMANGGKYFEDCNAAKLWRTDLVDDENSDELAKLYWDLSETIIKQKGFKLE